MMTTMKEIKEERFKKKEDIGFNPQPIPESPAVHEQGNEDSKKSERSNERTVNKLENTTENATAYIITIPRKRRKTRQSFDIFEDQYEALKKLQVAESEHTGSKTGPRLGDMVQEALDAFIKGKSYNLDTLEIKRE